ncbi:MAG: hypothetical protein KAH22_08790 [Thiotrichaceae bacterium]|nr:hypothetical protein [Thiotrichaceae bacterium]
MKRLYTLIILLIINTQALGVAALQTPNQEFIQPNNQIFTGTLKGDEHFNWIDLGKGYIALYNSDTQYYEYASINSSNGIVPSSVTVEQQLHTDNSTSHSPSENTETITEVTLESTISFSANHSSTGETIKIKPITKKAISQQIKVNKKIFSDAQIQVIIIPDNN